MFLGPATVSGRLVIEFTGGEFPVGEGFVELACFLEAVGVETVAEGVQIAGVDVILLVVDGNRPAFAVDEDGVDGQVHAPVAPEARVLHPRLGHEERFRGPVVAEGHPPGGQVFLDSLDGGEGVRRVDRAGSKSHQFTRGSSGIDDALPVGVVAEDPDGLAIVGGGACLQSEHGSRRRKLRGDAGASAIDQGSRDGVFGSDLTEAVVEKLVSGRLGASGALVKAGVKNRVEIVGEEEGLVLGHVDPEGGVRADPPVLGVESIDNRVHHVGELRVGGVHGVFQKLRGKPSPGLFEGGGCQSQIHCGDCSRSP